MTASWAPKIEIVVLAAAGAVLAAVGAALVDDRPGQVLLVVAAAMLALGASFGMLARPRLTADSTGVRVRGPLRVRQWSWGEVNVRLVHTRRLGRDTASVELDAEHDLVVLNWLDLGADPRDVADTLLAIRT